MRFENEIHINSLPESEYSSELVPAGWYEVAINTVEVKKTKDGTGSYLNIRYDITGPTCAGRVVFDKINISNKSEAAESIGLQQLRELMLATGLEVVKDTDQFVGKVLSIKIAIKKQEGFDDFNEVKGFKRHSVAAMPAFAASAASKPNAVASSKPTAPWAKK